MLWAAGRVLRLERRGRHRTSLSRLDAGRIAKMLPPLIAARSGETAQVVKTSWGPTNAQAHAQEISVADSLLPTNSEIASATFLCCSGRN